MRGRSRRKQEGRPREAGGWREGRGGWCGVCVFFGFLVSFFFERGAVVRKLYTGGHCPKAGIHWRSRRGTIPVQQRTSFFFSALSSPSSSSLLFLLFFVMTLSFNTVFVLYVCMLTIERCCRECVADLKRSISVGTASRRRRRSCCHRSNARDRRLDCQRRASCSAFGSSISQASPKGNSDKPLRHDRGTRGPVNSLYIYIYIFKKKHKSEALSSRGWICRSSFFSIQLFANSEISDLTHPPPLSR